MEELFEGAGVCSHAGYLHPKVSRIDPESALISYHSLPLFGAFNVPLICGVLQLCFTVFFWNSENVFGEGISSRRNVCCGIYVRQTRCVQKNHD